MKNNAISQLLPKVLYVARDMDDGRAYFVAYEDYDAIDAGSRVGVYELSEIKTKKVTHALE